MIPKEKFVKKIALKAVLLECQKIGIFQKKCKDMMLRLPKVKNIMSSPNGEKNTRMILLKEDVVLSAEDDSFIQSMGGKIVEHQLKLGYSFFSTHEVLKELLPDSIKEIPARFETIGHIAHFNLREEQLPYKALIGSVIMDRNKHIRTVVHKTSSIASEFRTFPMEVIAGDDDLDVVMIENSCKFKFNFKDVYWNSRLQGEHIHILSLLKPSDIVCDMMAGIGPFAVPAAKLGCEVFANDLNPHSFKYLLENSKINKVESQLKAYNMDGRDFVSSLREEGKIFTHILMNLPAAGIEFLDVFVNGCMDTWPEDAPMPMVHTYCFSRSPCPVKDVQERVTEVLGHNPFVDGAGEVREVRDVAPNKLMMCAEFRLRRDISRIPSSKANDHDHGTKRSISEDDSSDTKKPRI